MIRLLADTRALGRGTNRAIGVDENTALIVTHADTNQSSGLVIDLLIVFFLIAFFYSSFFFNSEKKMMVRFLYSYEMLISVIYLKIY